LPRRFYLPARSPTFPVSASPGNRRTGYAWRGKAVDCDREITVATADERGFTRIERTANGREGKERFTTETQRSRSEIYRAGFRSLWVLCAVVVNYSRPFVACRTKPRLCVAVCSRAGEVGSIRGYRPSSASIRVHPRLISFMAWAVRTVSAPAASGDYTLVRKDRLRH
jgi:hypothetical protein